MNLFKKIKINQKHVDRLKNLMIDNLLSTNNNFDGVSITVEKHPQPAHSNLFHDVCECSDCKELNKKINEL